MLHVTTSTVHVFVVMVTQERPVNWVVKKINMDQTVLWTVGVYIVSHVIDLQENVTVLLAIVVTSVVNLVQMGIMVTNVKKRAIVITTLHVIMRMESAYVRQDGEAKVVIKFVQLVTMVRTVQTYVAVVLMNRVIT